MSQQPIAREISADMTGEEIWKRTDELEAGAASLLGHMLFEFARIDMCLGLCLVWVDGGTKLDHLTPKVAELSFRDKLLKLRTHVEAKLPAGTKRRRAYYEWIERMDKARLLRNQLVHGRWGIEAHRNVVVNVVGLPTGEQEVTEYTIEGLTAVNVELRWLNSELGRLRTHWRL